MADDLLYVLMSVFGMLPISYILLLYLDKDIFIGFKTFAFNRRCNFVRS